jgi:uncharacterized protein (TIGR02444 family)
MSDIWEWARAAYARPGVADLCLNFQDSYGQNVCLLLWAMWARADEGVMLAEAVALTSEWEGAVIHPLRAARRALKAPFDPLDEPGREALRQDVKAAELTAERLLLQGLAKIGAGPGAATPADALAAAARAWGAPPPDAELAALAAALR